MAYKHHKKFPGFPASLEKAYWQFPTIINGYIHILTGAEFKVLWYVLRHTFGWQKSADRISISQICEGIKKKNGECLDKGTGLSRYWAMKSLNSLEKKGFIFLTKQPGSATIVSLNITGKESLPVKKIDQSRKLTRTGQESRPVTGQENRPTINNSTKDNKQYRECVGFADASPYSKEFLVFYEHYPVKKGKKAAWQAWQKAKDKPPLDNLLKAIEKQKNFRNWKEGFIPHPSTWLNQGRWDDEEEDKEKWRYGE